MHGLVEATNLRRAESTQVVADGQAFWNEFNEKRGASSETNEENVSHLAVAEFDPRLKKLAARLLEFFRSETRFPPPRPNIERGGELRFEQPDR
jgi:hypothetical protein